MCMYTCHCLSLSYSNLMQSSVTPSLHLHIAQPVDLLLCAWLKFCEFEKIVEMLMQAWCIGVPDMSAKKPLILSLQQI